MTICDTLGYILDIPQRSALICPHSGIEIMIKNIFKNLAFHYMGDIYMAGPS